MLTLHAIIYICYQKHPWKYQNIGHLCKLFCKCHNSCSWIKLCLLQKKKKSAAVVTTWYVPMCWLWPQHWLLHLTKRNFNLLELFSLVLLVLVLVQYCYNQVITLMTCLKVTSLWDCNMVPYFEMFFCDSVSHFYKVTKRAVLDTSQNILSWNHLWAKLAPLLFLRDKQTAVAVSASHFCLIRIRLVINFGISSF